MKKLFTLLVLMACFLGTNAKEVVDVEVDYTTATTWSHGWIADAAVPLITFEEGVGLHFVNESAVDPFYNVQFQPFPGIPSGNQDNDYEYTLTLKIKGTIEQTVHASFSGNGIPGDIPVTTSEQELTFTGLKNNPNDQYFKNSYTVLLQCGDFVGEWWITYVKITHEEAENVKPITWINFIENGDASAAWADPDASVAQGEGNWAYVGEGAEQVCAYAKEYGYNENIPHAAFIMEDDEQHGGVFYTTTVPCEEVGDPGWQWANQFWINFPRPLKEGEHLRLSFEYKASEAASGSAQGHRLPGDYLGGGFGDIAFTTEWQTFEQEFDAGANQQSLAFNLGINGQYAKEITFYFDNIKLEYMDLETGLFVAFTDTKDGDPAYNYDESISFEEDPTEEGFFVATVGGESEDKWVDEVMISTVRGNKKGFESGTIKVSGDIENDEEVWLKYEQVGKSKIKLPVRGQWQISIDTKTTQINFLKLAGEEDVEPVDIAVNTSELAIEGVERKYLNNDEAAAEGVELPEDYATSDPDTWGKAWDNQFWIVANRGFDGEEETIVEFDYYIISDEVEEAKVSTQSHGPNCNYIFYSAIGDITFTKEPQHFNKEFNFPQKDWQGNVQQGIQSIAFNMAEVRQACTYVIKNVKWYVKGDKNEQGLTKENLINAEGTDNFWVKIGAGTAPYQWGKKPADVEGDVNGDNEVGVGDLISVSNYMADGEESGVTKEKADVNKDDEVGVGDLITISNIMAGKEEE